MPTKQLTRESLKSVTLYDLNHYLAGGVEHPSVKDAVDCLTRQDPWNRGPALDPLKWTHSENLHALMLSLCVFAKPERAAQVFKELSALIGLTALTICLSRTNRTSSCKRSYGHDALRHAARRAGDPLEDPVGCALEEVGYLSSPYLEQGPLASVLNWPVTEDDHDRSVVKLLLQSERAHPGCQITADARRHVQRSALGDWTIVGAMEIGIEPMRWVEVGQADEFSERMTRLQRSIALKSIVSEMTAGDTPHAGAAPR